MSSDVHTLSGAYALDALSPEEADEFRRHLEGCESCRTEVREFRQAAALMGSAEAEAPPAELKARVLALADRTPQLPPRNAPRGTGATSAPQSGGRRWTAWIAAAAAAVVLIGGGAVGVRELLDDSGSGLSAAPGQVFEAGDVKTATVDTSNGGKLTVAVSPSRKEMAVDTRELPDLDDAHIYQIWAVHPDGQMVSAAILGDPEGGAAMGLPDKGTQVAVTVEPKGGSEQPTTKPIVEVDPNAV